MIRRLLAVAGLTGMVVAQPLLDLFGNSPATFQVNRVEGRAIVMFALAVTVIPPLLLWASAEAIRAVHARAGELLHIGTIALLAGGFGVLVAKEVSGFAPLNLLLGVAIAAGAALLYTRFEAFGLWVRLLAAANLFFLFQFVFVAPVADWIDSATNQAIVPTVGSQPDGVPSSGASSADPNESAAPAPVVMLVFDELPTQSILADDGGIDAVRFPNLAAFGQDATWYRRFTTTSPFTQSAVPSLLDGRDPFGDPTWVDHPDSLFSLLAGTHHLVVSEALTQMCGFETCGVRPVPPPASSSPSPTSATAAQSTADSADTSGGLDIDTSARWGALFHTAWDLWRDRVAPTRSSTPQGFDDFQEELRPVSETSRKPPSTSSAAPTPPTTTSEAPAQRTEEEIELTRFLDTLVGSQPGRLQLFIDALRPTDSAFFGYLHLVLPHQPWTLREDGTTYEVGAGRTDYEADHDDPWPVLVGQQRHLLQAEYADRLLGLILGRLEEIDEYDDALIIVVGDHGVAFEPGEPSRSLATNNLAAVAYTPLLVKAPGQQVGGADDQNINSTDVAPTVADILGIELGWDADGRPAGSPDVVARGERKYIYDYTDAFDYTFLGIREYDDSTEFAALSDGRFASIGPGEGRLGGLYRDVAGGELVGASADERFGRVRGSASVAELDRLRTPGIDQALIGEVAGRVSDAPAGATVLVAVNDRIVGASPLYRRAGQDNSFVVLLDSGDLSPRGPGDPPNEIRLGLRGTDGTIDELAVED